MTVTINDDISFDSLQKRFRQNIYASGKGRIRLEVLKDDLIRNVKEISSQKELHILDAGGGMGQMARWLAEKGHKVCIADISDRMLAIANEENYKAGLNDQIEVINSSIQELPFKLAGQKYDLVLLHGVIAWMQRPFEAISSILPLLRSGGKFSVLYFNKDKLLLKNAINGIDLSEKQEKRKLKKKRLLTPVNPISWQDFSEYCNQRKLKILCKTGVRIFYHFFARLQIPNLPEIEKYLALELKYCRQEPFASLGEHTHCIISTKRALS